MLAFRDKDGLLKIRTKLADSNEKEDFKFPILLPANDVVLKLIRDEHNITRRSRISVLYSDNGTKFVGANNALRTLDWDKIVVYSTAQKITWKFILPTAAWWGGWWERIVRMLKELLHRVLGKSIVNYEKLLTILCDCESIINARPLTYIHGYPNELLPLSPAMFIHGNSNCETPDLDQVDRSSLVKRTKYLQKLREDLRQRFRNEYLALLVHRGTRRNDALEVGDVVLIGHDNVRRIGWPLDVVLEVYPGKNGVLRVSRIRTSHGERIRPFQRLYPLEVSAKTEIGVLKASGKDSLPVEKTPESSTDHVWDSPTDYFPDFPVESSDNSEEKPPTKTR
ncbi:DUF5641 domain-containing protein [Trichonephila clavipes]|nr:DUF5641 domain-containing protein [Trichonephila clavipes]